MLEYQTPVNVTWHHKMSGKSHLLVLRCRHFYTAKNKGNKKDLDRHNQVYFYLKLYPCYVCII